MSSRRQTALTEIGSLSLYSSPLVWDLRVGVRHSPIGP
jgi:hypothetical protein